MLKFLIISIISSALTIASVHANEPRHEDQVTNLAYGHALFEFFQSKPLEAITQLEVALFKKTLPEQAVDAQLLLASLYFEYGLEQESQALFQQLLNKPSIAQTESNTHNKVWFNLAKVEYQQQKYASANQLLSLIQGRLSPQREAEKNYLLSHLSIQNQQLELAQKHTQLIPQDSIWSYYARYNLALALLKAPNSKQNTQGHQLMLSLNVEDLVNDEKLALKDHALLTLGLDQLQSQQQSTAIDYFSQIRLNSALSNQSLLATGWAWSQADQAEKALIYWQTLQNKRQKDLASQESFLTVPYAYEQLKQDYQAINYYQQAATHFASLLVDLSGLSADIQQGELIQSLHNEQLIEDHLNPEVLNSAPPTRASQYLYTLFADKAFTQSIKNYQELLDIKKALLDWQLKLPTLMLMLDERRRSFDYKRTLVQPSIEQSAIDQLQQQREQLAEQIKQAQNDDSSLLLSSETELEHLETVEYIQDLINQLSDQQTMDDEQQRLNRLSGLLLWDINTDYAPRLWQTTKQLNELDQTLNLAQQSIHSLNQAIPENDRALTQFQRQIAQQRERNEQLLEQTDQLISQQQKQINQLAINALNNYQFHIKQLQLNARYSLARLYDKLASNGSVQ